MRLSRSTAKPGGELADCSGGMQLCTKLARFRRSEPRPRMTEIDTETFLTDLYALREIVQFQTGVHRLKLTVWGRQGPPPYMLMLGMSLPSVWGESASSPSQGRLCQGGWPLRAS
jgi:hypothetical protein